MICKKPFCTPYKCFVDKAQDMKWVLYPAWSLHRLLEIYSTSDDDCFVITIRTFDDIIDDIEWSINRDYLNKKYLK